MELLTELWDKTTDAFTAVSEGISDGLVRVFGNANQRQIRRMEPRVRKINELEPRMQSLSNDELKAKTVEFRARLAQGESLDDLLEEAFAACREAGRRFLNMRHYDVQLMGGMVLHEGKIAEMVTGEGKTLVATLAAYLNALEGHGVHVVTVNDYLARRDAEWMSPLYHGLGLTVGAIQAQMDSEERQPIYNSDITYGTNNEFGFDYLRDNMKPVKELQVQRRLHYAIIDEVDSILVDEARTPLIISGPAFDDVSKYSKADAIARELRKGEHFEVKEKERTAHLTDAGVHEAERLARKAKYIEGETFYSTHDNMVWPHLIDNALKAHHLYKRDRDYVVMNGEIIIVDEFTGRLMTGRQWSDGLHQAVEAKERVRVKEENQTLATITLQNYFKLYNKLAGMTGTAMTEANEFWKVYKLDVVAVPTNRPLSRVNYPDVIYRTEREKYQAILDEIRQVHETGRPVLVGTTSIERSELISEMLQKYGIAHQVLNAKFHEHEAEIVAQAGRKGMVTIATNMAGRGTDIILGGNPEFMAWADLKILKNEDNRPLYPTRLEVPPEVWRQAVARYEDEMRAEGREVAALGGLHIIGTERHESRRIDNQLRGRSGRQGDPGSSRFFLSLEDDLMRKFAGEWVSAVLARLGMQDGDAIESKMVSRRIEGAQKKVEERNFDIRKNLLEYDEVMDEQRKRVYSFRQRLLDGQPTKDVVYDMIDEQIVQAVEKYLADDYGPSSYADWIGERLGVEFHARDFKNTPFNEAEEDARHRAEIHALDQVREALEENLPADAEASEWNWQALTTWANTRYRLNLKDRELRKFAIYDKNEISLDREALEQFLHEKAVLAIREVDLSEARPLLEPDYGRRSLAGWVQQRLGTQPDPAEWAGLPRAEVIKRLQAEARSLYARREAEFPVYVALAKFLADRNPGHPPLLDRDGLADWASQRYGVPITADRLHNLTRPEMEQLLFPIAHQHDRGLQLSAELDRLLDRAFGPTPPPGKTPPTPDRQALVELAVWAHNALGAERTAEELERLGKRETRLQLLSVLDARYRSEMRELEKGIILDVLDASWMEHLRTMDHLRSSVGLRGYAQVDPKVEYKREGMKIFEEMWSGIADQATHRLFHLKMDQLNPDFLHYLGARWQLHRARTVHEAPPSDGGELVGAGVGGGVRAQQEAAIESSQKGERKAEPVRHTGKKIGRNDPCPCGSGRKYKVCCMRKNGEGNPF